MPLRAVLRPVLVRTIFSPPVGTTDSRKTCATIFLRRCPPRRRRTGQDGTIPRRSAKAGSRICPQRGREAVLPDAERSSPAFGISSDAPPPESGIFQKNGTTVPSPRRSGAPRCRPRIAAPASRKKRSENGAPGATPLRRNSGRTTRWSLSRGRSSPAHNFRSANGWRLRPVRIPSTRT